MTNAKENRNAGKESILSRVNESQMQKKTAMQKKKAFCEERMKHKIRELSPTHEKPSQLLKPWVRQRFCELISELQGCVNLLNHHTAILDSILKMMPFDANVFCSRAEFIRFVCKFQATSIVFKNCGLMHACVNGSVLCESLIGRNTEIKVSG